MRLIRWCGVAVFVIASAAPLRADTILVTSGSLYMTGNSETGHLTMTGTGGFSLTSLVAPSDGSVGPFLQCNVPECVPGGSITLQTALSGAALNNGVLTIGGDRYEDLSSINSPTSVILSFEGSVLAPPLGSSTSATISAPFTLNGQLIALTPLGEYAHNDVLRGAGIATLTLVPYPSIPDFPPSWLVDTVRYDFAQPTPEPSTLVLLGTCALAAARKRFNMSHARPAARVGASSGDR